MAPVLNWHSVKEAQVRTVIPQPSFLLSRLVSDLTVFPGNWKEQPKGDDAVMPVCQNPELNQSLSFLVSVSCLSGEI